MLRAYNNSKQWTFIVDKFLFRPSTRLLLTFRSKLIFYGKEFFAPRLAPKRENYPLLAVCDCLFKISTATLH
jgi:hypothetical protein